jgi:FHA domain
VYSRLRDWPYLGHASMPVRLVALDEGSDIPLDRTMVVVGRHPQCDARLDSLRVSRHHCCMTQDNGEVVVRDLGSTNGIRINGQRVEIGRLRPGDELSIAHIRYRLDTGMAHEMTLADPGGYPGSSMPPRALVPAEGGSRVGEPRAASPPLMSMGDFEKPLAAAVRDILPPGMADKCRIQVILKMEKDGSIAPEASAVCRPDSSP